MKRNLFIVILIVLNIALDQITKAIVRSKLTFQKTVEIIEDHFQLIWVENKGAFLGMGSDMSTSLKYVLLLILPTIVLLYVVYFVIKTKSLNRLATIAFCCIAGGGISNIFDRYAFGEVTDFLLLKATEHIRTGVFNFADMSVSAGLVMLIFSGFLFGDKDKIM